MTPPSITLASAERWQIPVPDSQHLTIFAEINAEDKLPYLYARKPDGQIVALEWAVTDSDGSDGVPGVISPLWQAHLIERDPEKGDVYQVNHPDISQIKNMPAGWRVLIQVDQTNQHRVQLQLGELACYPILSGNQELIAGTLIPGYWYETVWSGQHWQLIDRAGGILAGDSGGSVNNITYYELLQRMSPEGIGLTPGAWYLLTDYRVKHYLPYSWLYDGQGKRQSEYRLGWLQDSNDQYEPLLLLAIGPKSLAPQVWSINYPQDIIWYDYNSSQYGADRGFIYYRHDTVRNLTAYYDWRHFKWPRWFDLSGSPLFARPTSYLDLSALTTEWECGHRIELVELLSDYEGDIRPKDFKPHEINNPRDLLAFLYQCGYDWSWYHEAENRIYVSASVERTHHVIPRQIVVKLDEGKNTGLQTLTWISCPKGMYPTFGPDDHDIFLAASEELVNTVVVPRQGGAKSHNIQQEVGSHDNTYWGRNNQIKLAAHTKGNIFQRCENITIGSESIANWWSGPSFNVTLGAHNKYNWWQGQNVNNHLGSNNQHNYFGLGSTEIFMADNNRWNTIGPHNVANHIGSRVEFLWLGDQCKFNRVDDNCHSVTIHNLGVYNHIQASCQNITIAEEGEVNIVGIGSQNINLGRNVKDCQLGPNNKNIEYRDHNQDIVSERNCQNIAGGSHNNSIHIGINSSDLRWGDYNQDLFLGSYSVSCILGSYISNCRWGSNNRHHQLSDKCSNNTWVNDCSEIVIDTNSQFNTFGPSNKKIRLGANSSHNTFYNQVTNLTARHGFSHNLVGNYSVNNTFKENCTHNILGDRCAGNTFGKNLNYNRVDHSHRQNQWGDDCDNNIIGSYAEENIIGSQSNNNIVGSHWKGNTIGPGWQYNELGHHNRYQHWQELGKYNKLGHNIAGISREQTTNFGLAFYGNRIANDWRWHNFGDTIRYCDFLISGINLEGTQVINWPGQQERRILDNRGSDWPVIVDAGRVISTNIWDWSELNWPPVYGEIIITNTSTGVANLTLIGFKNAPDNEIIIRPTSRVVITLAVAREGLPAYQPFRLNGNPLVLNGDLEQAAQLKWVGEAWRLVTHW